MGTIRIEGGPEGDGEGYTVTVDGWAEGTPDTGGDDGVRGNGEIYGDIGSGVDTYSYSGTVVSADLPDHATLYVDGQAVNPAAIGGGGSSYTPPGGSGGQQSTQPDTSTPTAPTTTTPAGSTTATAGLGGGDTTLLAGAAALALLAVYMVQS